MLGHEREIRSAHLTPTSGAISTSGTPLGSHIPVVLYLFHPYQSYFTCLTPTSGTTSTSGTLLVSPLAMVLLLYQWYSTRITPTSLPLNWSPWLRFYKCQCCSDRNWRRRETTLIWTSEVSNWNSYSNGTPQNRISILSMRIWKKDFYLLTFDQTSPWYYWLFLII